MKSGGAPIGDSMQEDTMLNIMEDEATIEDHDESREIHISLLESLAKSSQSRTQRQSHSNNLPAKVFSPQIPTRVNQIRNP